MTAVQPPTPAFQRGIVKQVLSGDTVIVRGQPRGGPPPEKTIGLSNVTAPKLARRPGGAGGEQKEEPYAWEAREYLRKKLIGKEILYTKEYVVPGSGKEVGCIYLGKDTSAENITESIVAEGLVEVKRMGMKPESNESQQKLIALEEAAKTEGKGKWAPFEEHAKHTRNVTWTIDNLRLFVDSHHQKPIDAVIEHVRDGCTVRAFLLPNFDYVTVMLSGIKCPMFKMNDSGETVAEQFAAEAKFFTEARLLQREVKIILESVSNQNFIGTVLHPNGNIAEFLLKEGYARCVDWSMGVVSTGPEKLRAAEKVAKEQKHRLWKDYKGNTSQVDVKDKQFTGKVVEIINGDGMVVKMQDGSTKKIFLASVRPPRPNTEPTSDDKAPARPARVRSRPLYDIPHMFEAREFLRKKLIGKKVQVTVDYVQPANNDYPEKSCCTVSISNTNVAEALISKGLGTVVRYRPDDDQRSSAYDLLLTAEARAQKKGAGVHSKKDSPVIRVADVSGDVNKAKQFLPFLQRAGKCEAVAEFVASGSRLRLYIPRETCLVTFLLSGISCPRGSRPDPSKPGSMIPSEPYGDEAAKFTRDLCLQHEVVVEVESMDKGGNFIGYCYVDGVNISVSLVENGLSSVHFTAERGSHYNALTRAEEKAKASKLKIWENFKEEVEEEKPAENEPTERSVNHKTVVVTELGRDLKFFAQDCDKGPQLEKLMEQLRQEMSNNPPLPGAYTPKRGDICAAKFVDGEWYRAKIEKVAGSKANVLYIDYGNREETNTTKLAMLPSQFSSLPAQAQEYSLACVQLPPEEDQIEDSIDAMKHDILDQKLLMNVEYKREGAEYVTLLNPDNKEDIGQALVAEGLLLVDNRREKRLAKLMAQYHKAQDKAKSERMNLWRYGDFTADDAKEFGYQR